eukprot:6696723-Prymnesium_polylepis.1
MVRRGGFEMKLSVRHQPLAESRVGGRDVVKADEGQAFEVRISNSNASTYMVRLFVDGVEAETGYVKKLRAEEEIGFRGYMVRKQIHEFLFAQTPVDRRASAGAPLPKELGEVRALVYATRRERVESSSSSDDYGGHRSEKSISSTALPEELAVKELGVQARPGSSIERISRMGKRRRGETRLVKVSPEVSTLVIHYRDELWWARQRQLGGGGAAEAAGGGGASSSAADSSSDVKVKSEPGGMPKLNTVKREAGETGRAPDGKRRMLATAPQGGADVVVLSD